MTSAEQVHITNIQDLVGKNEDVWIIYLGKHYDELCWGTFAVKKYSNQDLEDAGEFVGRGKTIVEALSNLQKDIERNPQKFKEIADWREKHIKPRK